MSSLELFNRLDIINTETIDKHITNQHMAKHTYNYSYRDTHSINKIPSIKKI